MQIYFISYQKNAANWGLSYHPMLQIHTDTYDEKYIIIFTTCTDTLYYATIKIEYKYILQSRKLICKKNQFSPVCLCNFIATVTTK